MDERFESALFRVGLAGRELGSGPGEAAKRVAAGVSEYLQERRTPTLNAECIALGVAIGLVMAEDPVAMEVIEAINREWEEERR